MIPKIVHYCWFGEKEIPKRLKNVSNHGLFICQITK